MGTAQRRGDTLDPFAEVLDGDRHAVEGTAGRTPGQATFGREGLGPGPRGQDLHEGTDPVVEGGDAGERGLEHTDQATRPTDTHGLPTDG